MEPNERINEINLLRQEEKWDQVESLAREMLEGDPESVFYLKALEQSLRAQGKQEDLPDMWKTLVEKSEDVFPYAQFLATWLVGEGRGNEAIPYFHQAIEAALKTRELDAIQEMCLELLDLDPHRLDYYLSLTDTLEARREKAAAAEILDLLLDHYKGLNVESTLLPIVHRLANHRPRDEKFRKEVVRIYRTLFRERPDLSLLVDGSGLGTEKNLPEAIERLEHLLRFGTDRFVYHNEWGVGRVSRLDPRTEEITVNFENRKSHRMALELAEKILDALPDDDLRAMVARDPEEVARLREEIPMALIYAAIRSLGGKANQRQLKIALTENAVPTGSWTGWWGKVGKTLVTDPRLAVSGTGTSKVYELRDEEIRFEDETRAEFDSRRDPSARVDSLLGYLQHCTEYGADELLLRQMAEALAREAETNRDRVIQAEILLSLEPLRKAYPNVLFRCSVSLRSLAADLDLGARILEGLRLVSHEESWVEVLREAHPEKWPKTFADLLLSPHVTVRDLLADALWKAEEGKRLLVEAFHQVSNAPRTYPGSAIWFCERGILHPEEATAFETTPAHLLDRLLRFLDHLAYAGRQAKGSAGADIRAHAAEIRSFLRRSRFQLVGDVLKTADTTIAESIWKSVSKNAGLDPGMQVELFKLIRLQFRDLAEPVEEVVAAQENASAEFLCTNESLTRKREDLRKLIEEDIPANSKDIEIAKGHGDLSENAEYQYAKERHQFLSRRVADLQQAIQMARPVDLRQVPTDAVCFGTRVSLKQTSSDSEIAYTILGPWESKPEENIISYLSPLGAAMLGWKIDDTVHFQVPGETAGGEFRIVGIEKTAI